MRRIATEEAWVIPEIAAAYAEIAARPGGDADHALLGSIYADGPRRLLLAQLLDLEEGRLAEMDAHGVAMHLLLLTAPGLQVFDPGRGSDLATLANDRLAEAIARHPDRYCGLAAVAPQAPERAVAEMERAIGALGLNGFVINSHTDDQYLDDQKYWPILEAAEALDRCLYIHPRGPSRGLAGPMLDYGLSGAIWGYGVEVATHALRLILSGALDRFPRLQICIGHMGEALPFWLWRIDNRWGSLVAAGRVEKLELEPSEYFLRNFVITTSGHEDPLALDFAVRKLGAERVLWAIDYPYQPTEPAVASMNAAPVSDEVRELLYHGNAERVFHIPPA